MTGKRREKNWSPKATREVFVVPFDYVREKCDVVGGIGINLMPKEYEPWMTGKPYRPKEVQYIQAKRELWLKSEKGQEWQKKKEEKQAKQAEINKKIQAHKKSQRKKKLEETEWYTGKRAVSAE